MAIYDRIGGPITLLGAVDIDDGDGGHYAFHYATNFAPDKWYLGESPFLRADGDSEEFDAECRRIADATPKPYAASIRAEFDEMVGRHEKKSAGL